MSVHGVRCGKARGNAASRALSWMWHLCFLWDGSVHIARGDMSGGLGHLTFLAADGYHASGIGETANELLPPSIS